MKKYLKAYSKKQNGVVQFLRKLSVKQKIALILLFACIVGNFVFAQTSPSSTTHTPHQALIDILKHAYGVTEEIPADGTTAFSYEAFIHAYASSLLWVETPRAVLRYIADLQMNSVDTVAKIELSTSGIFDHIYTGLTIFAIIGILVKLIQHFMKTERFDSVSAFTGFFSYFGILLLFIFSPQIVERVVGLNKPITGKDVRAVALTLDNEIVNQLKRNYEECVRQLMEVEKKKKEADEMFATNITGKVGLKISASLEELKIHIYDMAIKSFITYAYYTLFSVILVCILAVPAVILAFMVKILLSVMVAGTKLVFTVSMIPGFENTWKTFMMNILNVILWVPIFQVIMQFITNIVSHTLTDNSIQVGEIIWLSVICVIMAYQSITLTTSAAGTIISGAGASMAGALSGLASMNAVSMGAGMAKGAVNIGAGVASGGTTAMFTAKALEKYMK